MIDYDKLAFASSANTFKNVDVKNTSITLSGSIGAYQERTFTSTVLLSESQVFAFAQAKYADWVKGGSPTWQQGMTYNMSTPTTPNGVYSGIGYLLTNINGLEVTFTAGLLNGQGNTETITPLTVLIKYVTYTLAR